MNEFRSVCPHCGQRFHFGERLAGREVVCPRCRQRFVLRAQSEDEVTGRQLFEPPPNDDIGDKVP
jgi:DNA-directed RNA polymerase subunit RPC12/RpoP